jgi:hypothetical protein
MVLIVKGGSVKSHLRAFAPLAAAVALLVTAGTAAAAPTTDLAGAVAPDSCSKVQHVTVPTASHIVARVAATNAGGFAWTEILDGSGNVLSNTGRYDTTSGGTYGVRVCFRSGDGIDVGRAVHYFGTIDTPAA